VQIAFGSASEVEYHMLLARDLGFLGQADYEQEIALVHETKRMLNALLKKIQSADTSRRSSQHSSAACR